MMAAPRTPLFIANWKMHKTLDEVRAYCEVFRERARQWGSRAEVGIAPQAVHLAAAREALGVSGVAVVAQNCGQAVSGAHTGEVSPVALLDLGVASVLLGHSERRWIYHEDAALVEARLKAALETGLRVVLCVGERLVDRKEGKTFLVLEQQLSALGDWAAPFLEKTTVAYEPVWAIGTGETATAEQAQQAHAFIRQWVEEHFGKPQAQALRLLYGGSAKPENAQSLMGQPDVDGLLVGGASLDPLVFAQLVENGLRSLT